MKEKLIANSNLRTCSHSRTQNRASHSKILNQILPTFNKTVNYKYKVNDLESKRDRSIHAAKEVIRPASYFPLRISSHLSKLQPIIKKFLYS